MGSYAECWINSFYVRATKGDIDPSLMALFRSSNKIRIFDKNNLSVQLQQWIKRQTKRMKSASYIIVHLFY
jgi:hypothetical protein